LPAAACGEGRAGWAGLDRARPPRHPRRVEPAGSSPHSGSYRPPERRMDPSQNPNVFHATTIVCVRRGDKVAIAGDGQVTLGHTVMKGNARKVRRLGRDGQVLAGFAGAAADAFTLFELFEAKLEKHGQL